MECDNNLLLAHALRNNGCNDNGYGYGYVTPELLSASLANVVDTQMNTDILQTLGDIKAAVPLAEAQVQLALAGAVGEVRSHIGQVENTLTQGQANINEHIADAIAKSLQSQSIIKEAVHSTASQNLQALMQTKYDLAKQVAEDGDKTRALINANQMDELNRQLSVAQSALIEQRALGRSREVEVNVTQSVTQNQAQAQLQAQQQQQFQVLANLAASIQNLAGDIQAIRTTQSNVNFGVQGNAGQTSTAANNRVG